jgi:hypothetical protein
MTDQHDQLTTEPEGPGRSTAIAVGAVVLVLMVIVAVLAVASFDADDEQPGGDTAPSGSLPVSTTPDTAPEPMPTEPAERPGADSALVGLTELQVRELYPLVRVVELDGEQLPTTMDLQPGRINLALEGEVVVAATTEGCEEAGPQDADWLQQACDPDPATDGPDASGKLLAGAADGEYTLEVGTQGDQYYQGMAIVIDPDRTRVLDTSGAPITAQDLQPDDVVWIWTAGACAESSPVQCELEAVVVDRP